METYTLLRQFADSWMVLALMVFFLGMVVWVWLPSRRAVHDDAARMIFRNEQAPARDDRPAPDASARHEAPR
jgi:cytochrome c oxidase cbb3-type subunit 4